MPYPQTLAHLSDTQASEYMYQFNPTVNIPLSYLKQGENTFEGMACDKSSCVNWPQWGWMSMIVRIFYDPVQKDHPTGWITSPAAGETLGENPQIKVTGQNNASEVEVLAYYEGYDENGDGNYQDWHHGYFPLRKTSANNEISGHVGTDTTAPYQLTWDTSWVPDQTLRGIKLVARIKDDAGMWYVTDIVENLSLQRSESRSVKLYKPSDVPPDYRVRSGAVKSSKVSINDNLSQADAAQVLVRTWNGIDGGAGSGSDPNPLKVNSWQGKIGGIDHDYALTTPAIGTSQLTQGNNTISFHSTTEHHGIEILWPGPAIMVRWD